MIYAIAIFILTLVIKLIVDVRLYNQGKTNHHSWGPGIVAGCLATSCYIAGWHSIPMWLFSYWALFDTLYAILIKQKWYFIGTTAKLDILQHRYPVFRVLKYLLFIASIIYYVKY